MAMQKRSNAALVLGAGGFIGSHLVRRLKQDGFWVRGVDLKHPEFAETAADEFVLGDLRDPAPIWAAPATSSPAKTTPTSCTTRR
jgi:nucleoside-diphosphate-sugar epimerase